MMGLGPESVPLAFGVDPDESRRVPGTSNIVRLGVFSGNNAWTSTVLPFQFFHNFSLNAPFSNHLIR